MKVSLPKILRPFANMIESVTRDSDGVWVTLRDGYATDHGMGGTVIHEETYSACRDRLAADVTATTGDVEQCPNCKCDVEPWKLLPPGKDDPDGLCDECRPKVVIPD